MEKNTEKLHYGKTMLLGLSFLALMMIWALYNAYVPVLLDQHVTKTVFIGMIMSIDNIFAVLIQPVFGEISDRTHTRFGRRMPFILAGMPVCAVLFMLIPISNRLWMLMLTVSLFNLGMSVWRVPSVALMPDMTPRELRPQANGVINLMGGLGSIIALLAGGILLKNGEGNIASPFFAGGILMLVVWALVAILVKENPLPKEEKAEKRVKRGKEFSAILKNLFSENNRALILLLVAILFWFAGINVIETYFTLYAAKTLALAEETASFLLAIFAGCYMAGAIPAGFAGKKWGRKKAILVGLILDMAAFLTIFLTNNLTIIYILLPIGGAGWALVSINSLPLVLDLAPERQTGRYTGYYYFFSMAASIISPILFGLIRDLVGSYALIFAYALIAFLLATFFLLMGGRKNGYAHLEAKKMQPTEEGGENGRE